MFARCGRNGAIIHMGNINNLATAAPLFRFHEHIKKINQWVLTFYKTIKIQIFLTNIIPVSACLNYEFTFPSLP